MGVDIQGVKAFVNSKKNNKFGTVWVIGRGLNESSEYNVIFKKEGNAPISFEVTNAKRLNLRSNDDRTIIELKVRPEFDFPLPVGEPPITGEEEIEVTVTEGGEQSEPKADKQEPLIFEEP